jgi:hypothetical protein
MYILVLVKRYIIYIYEMVTVVSICVDNIVTCQPIVGLRSGALLGGRPLSA